VDAYQERSRPAIWGPVLLAVIFLAIIGGSIGWVLGSRERAAAERAADEQVLPQGGAPTRQPAVEPVDGNDGGGTNGGERPVSGRGDGCPEETARLAADAGARGELSRALYARTDGAEVWICVDAAGRLFYQGHRGGPDDPLIEGKTSLFLTDVSAEGGGYRAVNTTRDGVTTYAVDCERLATSHAGGDKSGEPVRVCRR
jgi:hypothetical protein